MTQDEAREIWQISDKVNHCWVLAAFGSITQDRERAEIVKDLEELLEDIPFEDPAELIKDLIKKLKISKIEQCKIYNDV